MPIETLPAASPVTVPAKVFDKVWVEEIIISAPDANADASAIVRLRLFAEEDGVKTLLPSIYTVRVESLLATAPTDPELDAAVTALMTYVAKVAIQEGIVAAPAP